MRIESSGSRVSPKGVRTFAAATLAALVLQGCGGGGEAATAPQTDAPPAPTVPVPTNHSPTISGSAPQSVQAGQPYTFTPAASDADGDRLTFNIANKPQWASFDTSTGRISGTPAAASVGSFGNVIVSVSDGTTSAALSAFNITVTAAPAATTGSATLSWTPPIARIDDSVLTNLAGYKIYYGLAAGTYTKTITIQTAGIATYTVPDLTPGTYFFVVTAIDATGYESEYSISVSKTIG